MKYSRWAAASALPFWMSISTAAMAQSSDTVGDATAPLPTAPITAPDPDEPQAPVNGTSTPRYESEPMLAAPTIPLDQEQRGDTVERTWPNRPMLVTGLVVFGGTYGASAIVGAASNREADDKLFLPVVGPWLDLADRGCDVDPCSNETLNKVLLVGDGALQGLGALTLLLSLVVPESKQKPWYLIGDEKLTVTPRVGTVNGLSAFGNF